MTTQTLNLELVAAEGDKIELPFTNPNVADVPISVGWSTRATGSAKYLSDFVVLPGPSSPNNPIPVGGQTKVTISIPKDAVTEQAEDFTFSTILTAGTGEFTATVITNFHVTIASDPKLPKKDVPVKILTDVAKTAPTKEAVSTLSDIAAGLVDNTRAFQNRTIDLETQAEIAKFADPNDFLGIRRAEYIADLKMEGLEAKVAFEGKTSAVAAFTDRVGKALLVVGPAIDFAERYIESGDTTDAAIVAGRKLLSGLVSGEVGSIVGTATTALLTPVLGPGAILAGVAVGTVVGVGANSYVDNELRIKFNQFLDIPVDTGKENRLSSPGIEKASAFDLKASATAAASPPKPAWSFNATTGEFKWLVAPTAQKIAAINAKLGIADNVQAGLNIVDDSGVPVISGTSDADKIRVVSAATVLDGRGGHDTLVGAGGSDALYGGSGNDTLQGGGGKDLLDGEAGDDRLIGGTDVDLLFGHDGNDSLDGGSGVDRMAGGKGNDTYVVDKVGDLVIETNGQGVDTIQSAVTFALVSNVENLTLLGTAALNGIGNGLNNVLIGNAGKNTLNGGSGDDTIAGGAGNDSIVGGNGDDVLMGGVGKDDLDGGAGMDTADYADKTTPVSVSLNGSTKVGVKVNGITEDTVRNIENVIGGSGKDALTGDHLANRLEGAAGSDTLKGGGGKDALLGGAGNDVLVGGSGKDQFVFNLGPNPTSNVDRVTDFSVIDDTIVLENAIFKAFATTGKIASSAFYIGSAAHDANDRIIYNKATGDLFYDSNGNASGGSVQFADLSTGLSLTHLDFLII